VPERLHDLNRIQLSRHFKLSEFECRCKLYCGYSVKITPGLLTVVELIWERLNMTIPPDAARLPLLIRSGYRCPVHNGNVGGRKDSYHCQGRAADLATRGMSKARLAGIVRELVGMHIYPFRVGFYRKRDHEVLHVDTGEGPEVFGDGWPV
jgi:hypothetical protein